MSEMERFTVVSANGVWPTIGRFVKPVAIRARRSRSGPVIGPSIVTPRSVDEISADDPFHDVPTRASHNRRQSLDVLHSPPAVHGHRQPDPRQHPH